MIELTKDQRDSLTPSKAVEILKGGNARFVNNLKSNRDLLQQVNQTSDGQHPFAIVFSCIDSRTSAELIFDQGLGDVFSCRIAGNVISEDILGSMEFACKVAGAKLIVVLGHTGCGAIQGACDGVKMGNLTGLVDKILPAVRAEKTIIENRNSQNHHFVNRVAAINVTLAMRQIVKKSSILSEMVSNGEIAIVGGMYDVGNGLVNFEENVS